MCITLVTYTYNDHQLVNGLLDSVRYWSRKPDAIIVVDDGSDGSYVPVPTQQPLEMLRNTHNMGTAYTKARGISSASTQFVVSLDCDIRLTRDWLAKCLTGIDGPEVGLVSSPLKQHESNTFYSRYFSIFGDNHNFGRERRADFLTGGAWLFSKDVWDRVGGFDGHKSRIHEDHHFCAKLRQFGYNLKVEQNVLALQVRQISRRAIIRKIWSWFERQVKQQDVREQDVWAMATLFFIPQSHERINTILNKKCFEMVYMEIAYTAYALYDLLAWKIEQEGFSSAQLDAFKSGVQRYFSAYPAILHLLYADFPEIAAREQGVSDTECVSFWSEYLGILKQNRILRLIDARLIEYAAGSASGNDFSMYEDISYS